ncbi:hypothetical protein E2562_007078 [Oryza meyeriana var. granulata]|uniref:Uncharacterized protein n=1 Tax=Oryza meyeriana var. granulata TaxID=110450 RepID=A0A6G1F4P4_9ORYZ|nr:hypothetical protein E2562_007078 [Oryza meyeriana var. granulata]
MAKKLKAGAATANGARAAEGSTRRGGQCEEVPGDGRREHGGGQQRPARRLAERRELRWSGHGRRRRARKDGGGLQRRVRRCSPVTDRGAEAAASVGIDDRRRRREQNTAAVVLLDGQRQRQSAGSSSQSDGKEDDDDDGDLWWRRS